jgi:hypothetical protein
VLGTEPTERELLELFSDPLNDDDGRRALYLAGSASREPELDELRASERAAQERAATAEARVAELRDCGQHGVCVLSPGCCRHWEERNLELLTERDEARARLAEVERERDNAARAVTRLRDAVHAQAIRLDQQRAAVEAARPFVATLSGAWSGPETLNSKLSSHAIAGPAYRRFKEALASAGSSSPQDSEPSPKPEPPAPPQLEHNWYRGLDGAYHSHDWTCGRCGAGVDGAEPSAAGCPGRAAPKPETASFPALPIDANDEAIVDAMMAKRQGETRPLTRREAETAEVGTSGPIVEGDIVEVHDACRSPTYECTATVLHIFPPDGKLAELRIHGEPEPEDGDYPIAKVRALRKVGHAEPVAQGIDSRELKHVYEAASLLRCLELQGAWYGFENASQCNRFDAWRDADRRLASYGFEEPVAQDVSRERRGHLDRAIRALYDVRHELTSARRAGSISRTQAVELTSIELVIDALEAAERKLLAASPDGEQVGGR